MTDQPDHQDALDDQLSDSCLTRDQLVELLRADQRRRWRTGQPLSVSAYLERFPQIRADPTYALDLIWSEYLIRENLGDRPSLEEYTRAFPQFESLLERQHRVHDWIEQAELTGDSTFTLMGPSLGPPRPTETAQQEGAGTSTEYRSVGGQDYEILDEIGRGAMGIVYRAFDRRRARVIALKMMRNPDPSALYRFKQEFHSLADISHQNLVGAPRARLGRYRLVLHDGLG